VVVVNRREQIFLKAVITEWKKQKKKFECISKTKKEVSYKIHIFEENIEILFFV
jgi:hypothetical protein